MHTVPNLSSEQRQRGEVRFRNDSTGQLCQLQNKTVCSASPDRKSSTPSSIPQGCAAPWPLRGLTSSAVSSWRSCMYFRGQALSRTFHQIAKLGDCLYTAVQLQSAQLSRPLITHTSGVRHVYTCLLDQNLYWLHKFSPNWRAWYKRRL